MNIDREKLQELAALYALGALEGEERKTFEALLKAKDPDALAELAVMQQALDLLPYSVEPVTPPEDLKADLMRKITDTSADAATAKSETTTSQPINAHRESAVTTTLFWKKMTWGLALAGAAAFLVGFIYVKDLQSQLQQLRKQVEISQQVIQTLQSEVQQKNEYLAVIQDAHLRVIDVKGLAALPQGTGKVLLSPKHKEGVFIAENLQQPAADKDYQLWMLKGNQPVDAGILKNENGQYVAHFKVDFPLESLSAFAVTIEPKGGVPQPTGTMILLGTTSGT
jgi:anti-sigma-K factor RskA